MVPINGLYCIKQVFFSPCKIGEFFRSIYFCKVRVFKDKNKTFVNILFWYISHVLTNLVKWKYKYAKTNWHKKNFRITSFNRNNISVQALWDIMLYTNRSNYRKKSCRMFMIWWECACKQQVMVIQYTVAVLTNEVWNSVMYTDGNTMCSPVFQCLILTPLCV